jgi:chorismate mutase / prephenate dehydrogenase
VTARLDELRARIADVDASLVNLVAARLALAREVGDAKRAAGLPVRNYATESEVLARFHALAAQAGLDDRLAERFSQLLIGEAVRTQESDIAAGGSPGQRILIVGGAGKIGRWLADFFASQGHGVTTLDPAGSVPGFPAATDLSAAVRDADAVILTTPLAVGHDVLGRILALEPRALVADAFSLKSHVLDLLEGAGRRGQRVASIHPLFGPGARTLSGRVMAVCDCGNRNAADDAAALFTDTALTITRIPVAVHDELMQYVLGLSHLVAILFFTTLARSGRSYADLSQVASTTYLKEARTAAEVARESPGLYYEIQRLNRHSGELFALVRSCLTEIERAALADDATAFSELMRAGLTFFPESLPAELG